MVRATSAVLLVLVLALPSAAFASLGGTVSSVEADRVKTQSALIRIQRIGNYSVHEMQSPTGTLIREYYGSDGIVFGVAWDGEWKPDLRQLLGTYFEQYARSTAAARRTGASHHRLAVNEKGL